MEKEEEGGDVVDLRLQSEAGEKLNGERIVWAARGGNVTEDAVVNVSRCGCGWFRQFRLTFFLRRASRVSGRTRMESQKVGRTHHLSNSP